jgi:hypothetical protein
MSTFVYDYGTYARFASMQGEMLPILLLSLPSHGSIRSAHTDHRTRHVPPARHPHCHPRTTHLRGAFNQSEQLEQGRDRSRQLIDVG